MRIFSSGGGVQSTAALILSAQGEIDYPVHIFSNVGIDSEHPDTLAYMEDVIKPYAKKHGVEFIEVQKRWMGKHEKQTIYGEIYRRKRDTVIPVRMSNGAPGNRTCTVAFKIRIVDKWIAENGGKGKDIYVGLGITIDEIHRARLRDPEIVRGFTKHLSYPLIDLSLTRMDCQNLIAREGLPATPRSSCYFCPFHSPAEWVRLRNRRPDLFEKAVAIERHINEKRVSVLKKDKVWLHPACRPLDIAVGMQMSFDDLENCESGYCMV